MKIKYLVSALIIIILIFLLFSQIKYPDETKPINEYEITFSEYQLNSINESGETHVNNPTKIIENISQLNITKVIFILTWVDDITSSSGPGGISIPFGCEDTFRLNVTDPNGKIYTNESENRFIKITIKLNDLLDNQTKRGKSEKEIYDFFKNENGTGKWIIDIICTEATGGGCLYDDSGNDWNLSIEFHSYKSEIKKIN